VNTAVRRWQNFAKDGSIVNRRESGFGVLRLRPSGHTLLYEQGYVRPPMDVVRLVPDFTRTLYQRLRQMRLWNRRGSGAELAGGQIDESTPIAGPRTDIAEGLQGVVHATQFATIAFGVGLVFTLVAALLDAGAQTVLQYLATLGFVLAWAAISSGAYQRNTTWLRVACLKSLKWWVVIFVPVGLLNLVFAVANKRP